MLISFQDIRLGIVLLATVVPFVIWFFWYGPLFGKRWIKEVGITKKDIKRSSMPKIFGISFASTFVTAIFIGGLVTSLSRDFTIVEATVAGALLGLGLAVASLTTVYIFAERSLALLLIDGGYIVFSCATMGFIFGWLL